MRDANAQAMRKMHCHRDAITAMAMPAGKT
jgi:hypothetical protein